jgi:hypothetical protein
MIVLAETIWTTVTMTKIVFLGMSNPQGNPPLSLEPRGGAGWRLRALAQDGLGREIPAATWRQVFDFRNVLPGRTWSSGAARMAAPAILDGLRGRRVVVLGLGVLGVLRLPGVLPCAWAHKVAEDRRVITYALVPHPSGRNRFYNDVENRGLVAKFLSGLYLQALEELV